MTIHKILLIKMSNLSTSFAPVFENIKDFRMQKANQIMNFALRLHKAHDT